MACPRRKRQLIFGLTFCVGTGLIVLVGRLQDVWGPRLITPIGGVCLGAGYLVSSFSKGSFPILLLGYGVLGGAGIGFCYVCPIATCTKWFTARKGVATGFVVAGYGAGAVLLSNMANILLGRGYDVLQIFRAIGIIYGGIIILSSLPALHPETATAASG